MKILSLFDGISCGMVALERAGIHVERYVAYEIEPNAIKISKKNYPQIEHCGDVTTADFKQYEGFDLLIGGSPCTNWSCAKNHTAKVKKELFINEGEGWELFKQYARAVEEAKPKYFLYENNYRISQNIVDAITSILGVEPIMIDSALVSAQRRKRLYWTNIPNIEQPEDKRVFLRDVFIPDETLNRTDERIIQTAIKKQNYIQYAVNDKHSTSQAFRLYYLHGKAPTIARCRTESKCNILIDDNDLSTYKIISPIEAERLQTLPDNYTEGVPKTRRFESIGNGWTVDVIAHIFTYLKQQESEEKEMKLDIKPYNPVEQILFNYEELKAEIQGRAAVYSTLVYTDETIEEAKADKAALNKRKKALNDERIKREKEYMQPFNDFKAKINELIRIIDDSIGIIDKQIKEVDEQKKNEKLNQIQAYWNNVTSPEHPLTLQRVMNPKWLNVTTSMKSIQDEINGILAQYAEDIATLQNLPEYGFEAIEAYKVSLDLRNAMNEAHRLSEMAKRKAEAERIAAERKAAEEAKKAEEIPCTPYKEPVATATATANTNGESVPVASVQVETPQRMWVSFRAHLTTCEAFALKAFLNEHEISFEAI